jgi:hypothetical protein
VLDALRLKCAWPAAAVAMLLLAVPSGAWADDAAKHAAAAQAALAVPLHEAIYHATVRRIPVRAGLRLERQNDGLFLYRSWVEPRGMFSFIRRELTETSLIKLDAEARVLPISYRRRDDVGGRGSDMRFDHSAGKLQIDYRGERSAIEWEPGIYDLLSLRLAIAHDLARGALQDVYRIVDDRGRVEAVDVEVAGRETLSTPLGELETVRLEYSSERRDRVFRLWIAPDKDSAMVRLEQFEEGRLRGRLELVEYRRL